MADELPLDQATRRFKRNEQSINTFVNAPEGEEFYETSEGERVPTLPKLLPAVVGLTDQAHADAVAAREAANRAEAAAMIGTPYISVQDGIDKTESGETFRVVTGDPNVYLLYGNRSGEAFYIGILDIASSESVRRIAEIAGQELDLSIDDINVTTDGYGHVVERLHHDGTRQMLGVKVGGYEIQQGAAGEALSFGDIDYEGLTVRRAVQLYGRFSGAVRVVCDEAGHVIEVEWPSGAKESTEGGSGSDPSDVVHKATWLLPDSTSDRDPPGFTCTGLDRITRGQFAGCWVVGDDGRIRDSSSSPYVPRIHILDPECRRILRTIDPGYTGASLQAVTVDTSGAADTLWIATAGNRRIIHITLEGTEITDDEIEWDLSSNPNGAAYDPANHALWTTSISGRLARLIACDRSASPRIVREINLTSTSPDQLHYDPVRELLYYSTGGNGVNGTVRAYNLRTDEDTAVYPSLKFAQAIEGIYVDRDISTLFVTNDAGYHVAGRPQLNCMLSYSVPLIN